MIVPRPDSLQSEQWVTWSCRDGHEEVHWSGPTRSRCWVCGSAAAKRSAYRDGPPVPFDART